MLKGGSLPPSWNELVRDKEIHLAEDQQLSASGCPWHYVGKGEEK